MQNEEIYWMKVKYKTNVGQTKGSTTLEGASSETKQSNSSLIDLVDNNWISFSETFNLTKKCQCKKGGALDYDLGKGVS